VDFFRKYFVGNSRMRAEKRSGLRMQISKPGFKGRWIGAEMGKGSLKWLVIFTASAATDRLAAGRLTAGL
jgi:hypothetical protein